MKPHGTDDTTLAKTESDRLDRLGADLTFAQQSSRDDNQWKRAEEALREARWFSQEIMACALEGIIIYGRDLKCRAWNRFMERMTGVPASEVLGKDPEQVFPFLRECDVSQTLRQALTGETTSAEFTFHFHGAGAGDWVETTSGPLRDSAGEIVGVIRIVRDISGRKALEAQLRQSQKLEAFGQLAGGVAHDFNNLLAVIHGNAELLLMDADQFSAKAAERLAHVMSAAERAASLTRQLLIFGRKQAMHLEPILLNSLIANLAKMLDRVIREDIRLECRHSDQLPFVQADAGMVEQVLINLVVNARDAMPHGGQLLIVTDKVTIDAAQASANPEARAGEFVSLAVSDTGTGIAPELLPRIFEPFFTTKESGKGTGLGLATVCSIIKQHQGWIDVSSRVGSGTTFKIFLPAIATPPRATIAPPVEAKLGEGTETILLVEDDLSVRTITRCILETFKYRVYEATCAREAREIWNKHAGEIALVLTDIVLPEAVSGRDLLKELRRERPQTKVVLMSGYSGDVLGQGTDFFRRTNSHFLQKPFSSTTLIRTVRQCLDEVSG